MMTTTTINAVMAPRRGNPDIKMAIAMASSKAGTKGERTIRRISALPTRAKPAAATGTGWVRSGCIRTPTATGIAPDSGQATTMRAVRGFDRDGDSDNFPAVYGGGSYGGPWFGSRAYQIGFQDGASVAREDAARGKPYNPRPRGRYDDEDHGYSSAYGNKGAHKTQYANGYRAGYESARGRY